MGRIDLGFRSFDNRDDNIGSLTGGRAGFPRGFRDDIGHGRFPILRMFCHPTGCKTSLAPALDAP